MTGLFLSAVGYLLAGVMTARQVLFIMENLTDRNNAIATQAQDAWEAEKKACTNRDHYRCHYEYQGPQVKTMQGRWGDGRIGYPLGGGALWPLTWVVIATHRAARIVWGVAGVPATSGVHWFFENPKHRKARNLSQVTRVT